MEKAISQITIFNTSKEGINKYVNQCIQEVEAGILPPLHMAVYLKTMEKIIEGIQKGIKESALAEAEKYEKSFDFHGARIEMAELGTKYDYTSCGDIVLNELNKQISELSEKKKEHETMLKTVKEGMTMVDENTGEIYKIFPPIKSSTTGIKITIK